jgi:transposase
MAVMNTEKQTPPERRGRYPKEFRRDSAALVIDQQRTVAGAATSLGLNSQTLGNWVRQERVDLGEREDLTRKERAEMVRLQRENRELREERDLLKKPRSFG